MAFSLISPWKPPSCSRNDDDNTQVIAGGEIPIRHMKFDGYFKSVSLSRTRFPFS